MNPDLPVPGIVRMTDRIAQSVAGPRFFSMMVSMFAAVALLLAAGGMYSSMLYLVQSRYRELGLRVALGARSGQVVTLILRQGLWLVAGGTVLGLLGAMSLSGVLETMVFGVSPTDLPTLTVMAGVLGTVALVACYVPARKAANADPIETLRAE